MTSKFLLAVLLSIIIEIYTIKCKVGYGQRGLMFQNEMSWTRTCPNTKYCFEAITTNINKVKKLIDYPWVINCCIGVRSKFSTETVLFPGSVLFKVFHTFLRRSPRLPSLPRTTQVHPHHSWCGKAQHFHPCDNHGPRGARGDGPELHLPEGPLLRWQQQRHTQPLLRFSFWYSFISGAPTSAASSAFSLATVSVAVLGTWFVYAQLAL